MSRQTAFAPAKINLFLHVGEAQPDGYHPLSSWMVFADVGDQVTVAFDNPPTGAMTFVVDGPFAASVPTDGRNLVVRARDALLGDHKPDVGFRMTLTKRLPPASGMGGGSSDAAATLRALNFYLDEPARALYSLAATLGADVPACLRGESLIATGRGEVLSAAPRIPLLHAVLVNPGVEAPTGKVFGLYDVGAPRTADMPPAPDFATVQALIEWLGQTRNDLEAPAMALCPQIGAVLDALYAAPESLMARMSGSGATCFALCEDRVAAKALVDRLAKTHPGWWAQACHLGGPWPDDFTRP